jgi:hypothetical protein
MNKGIMLGGLAASHLAVFGFGWALSPDHPLDEEVQQTGLMKVEATKVLEATVQSLRAENKLLVFSYKGSARVKAERTYYLIFSGNQQLQIPAVVNGTVRNFVCGRAVEHYAAMTLMKRSPNRTANWALAMDQSRGGILHSFSDRFKIR